MQKKIFMSICITVMVSVILFGVIALVTGYKLYSKEAQTELETIAKVVTGKNYTNDEIVQILEESLDYEVRYTLLDIEGNVIFDSRYDLLELENHKERKEISQALENGSGHDNRLSKTTAANTFYYALKDGDYIYRFARERNSIITLFLGVAAFITAAAAAVIVVATIVSVQLAENAIKPVTKMVSQLDVLDSEKELDVEYEELEPIVHEVKRLSSRLSRYINRLKNEKEKITLITDNMVEGMILLDENSGILSVNKSAVRFLNPDFVMDGQKQLSELSRNQKLIDAVFQAEKEGASYGVIPISNRQIQFFINKASFNNTHGFIILLVDASEKLKAEEIRKDFSANVSHELKTPLTTIKGFGEMLENGIFIDEGSVKKYGGMIYRESERLLLLINDIIRLSEIEETTDERSLCDVDLFETAKDVEEILQLKADKHKITISVEGESFEIKAHKSYMSELLLNLMDNSIKYNSEGGYVWVNISKKGSAAHIVVKDDGIGISPEHQDRIFERFYRVDKSRSTQTGGTGLGLSIVKHIATYHHGSVSIDSRIGEGTKITVTIPIFN